MEPRRGTTGDARRLLWLRRAKGEDPLVLMQLEVVRVLLDRRWWGAEELRREPSLAPLFAKRKKDFYAVLAAVVANGYVENARQGRRSLYRLTDAALRPEERQFVEREADTQEKWFAVREAALLRLRGLLPGEVPEAEVEAATAYLALEVAWNAVTWLSHLATEDALRTRLRKDVASGRPFEMNVSVLRELYRIAPDAAARGLASVAEANHARRNGHAGSGVLRALGGRSRPRHG